MRKNTAHQMTIPNMHILTVKFIGPGNVMGSRIKIISKRFKQSVTFDYSHTGDNSGNTLEQAEYWLISHGFNITGHAEGEDHYYVISSTFEGLQDGKEAKMECNNNEPMQTFVSWRSVSMERIGGNFYIYANGEAHTLTMFQVMDIMKAIKQQGYNQPLEAAEYLLTIKDKYPLA